MTDRTYIMKPGFETQKSHVDKAGENNAIAAVVLALGIAAVAAM